MTDLYSRLEQRVRDFIQDRYVWQTFVAENIERYSEMKDTFAARYRVLIDKYCSAGKAHQGLHLSGEPSHAPKEEHIIKFEADEVTAIVFTEVRKAGGGIEPHEFEFMKIGEDWYLQEVYFNDGSGRYECL